MEECDASEVRGAGEAAESGGSGGTASSSKRAGLELLEGTLGLSGKVLRQERREMIGRWWGRVDGRGRSKKSVAAGRLERGGAYGGDGGE